MQFSKIRFLRVAKAKACAEKLEHHYVEVKEIWTELRLHDKSKRPPQNATLKPPLPC